MLIFQCAIRAQTGKITVTIEGIENKKGMICIGLYHTKEKFPKIDQWFKGVVINADINGVAHTFDSITPGKYAIGAFHDENRNMLLDRNMLSIPTENYGFSNNVFGHLGPPEFEEAAFLIEKDTTVFIKIMLK